MSYGLNLSRESLQNTEYPGDKSTGGGGAVLMKGVAKRYAYCLTAGDKTEVVWDKMDVRSNETVPFTDLITASGSLEKETTLSKTRSSNTRIS